MSRWRLVVLLGSHKVVSQLSTSRGLLVGGD